MEKSQLLKEFLSLVSVDDFDHTYAQDIRDGTYFGLPLKTIVEAEKKLLEDKKDCLAYFSMEYGLATSVYNRFTSARPLDPRNKTEQQEVFSNYRLADYYFSLKMDSIIDLPIYSGGLGVLAGDTLKTMADYRLPFVAVGVLWNTGYFRQKFWYKYGQMPERMNWDLRSYPGLIPLKNKVKISLRNEDVYLRLWKYYVYSYTHESVIPLVLLDANVEENREKTRRLTDQLYKSDDVWVKIMQRVILGMGGVAALRELGYTVNLFHMNEGHAAFSFVERARGLDKAGVEELKKHFVYTCHTPVEAGHDRFSSFDVNQVLFKDDFDLLDAYGKDRGNTVNLTLFAMNISSKINAVSRRHAEVMHLQFPRYKDQITYVTNGVHAHTWMSDRFKSVMEKYSGDLGDIKANPMALAKTADLRGRKDFREAVWQAHQENKKDLCALFGKWKLDPDVLTICWARRVAAYKRPSLILHDVQRLLSLAKKFGPLQVIIAGKAHPNDNLGFTFINEMMDKVDGLAQAYEQLKIIMPENYDITLAKKLVSSADIWLNNPLPPFEASGTSGMKAILNAVLQVSTLDGWIVEAADSNIGRIFGYVNPAGVVGDERDLHMADDARQLYAALEEMIRLYYETNRQGSVDHASSWIDLMINCLATGSMFNTYRMLDQYKHAIWSIH